MMPWIIVILLITFAPAPWAEEPVLFSRDIAPILQQKCLTCHNPEKAKGGYRVDTFANVLLSGKSKEPTVVPEDPEHSELFERLVTADEDDRMPQNDEPLSADKIELIRKWITQGAKLDKGAEADLLTSLLEAPAHPPAPERYPFPVPVLTLAFDSTGAQLYVGGYNEVTVWSAGSGELLRRMPGFIQRVHGLILNSARNEMIVGGGIPGLRGEVAAHPLERSTEREVLLAMADEVLGIATSTDGSLMAAFGSDNSIHIFNTETKTNLLSIQQHADWVMSASFSPDSKHIVSASRDRTARVYDCESGNLESTYMGHNAPVYAAVFNRDGKSVISGGRGKTLHIWSIENEKKTGELGGFKGDVHALLLLGDTVLSGCSDGVLREHSISDKKLVREFKMESPVFSLTHHQENGLIAAGTRSGGIKVWNQKTGEEVCSFVASP